MTECTTETRGTPAEKQTMTRKDLKRDLHQLGFTMKEATGILDAIFAAIRDGLNREGRVDTPIGLFNRRSKGSTCITNSLEGHERRRRIVRRRSAISFEFDPPHTFEKVMAALERGEGRIWWVKRWSGRRKDEARYIFQGDEGKAWALYMKLYRTFRRGTIELLNASGRVRFDDAAAIEDRVKRKMMNLEAYL